ncbi:MAG: DoxX family membrane protein [Chloroflexi bacterium]|nr:DoxX family membrane protein [Chloroflexota bacterium]
MENIVNAQSERQSSVLQNPRWITALFSDTRFAWLWLIARVYIGWQWLDSGLGKVTQPAWIDTGAAVKGFWERAVVVPETGRAPIAYDWYRGFLEFLLNAEAYTWFAKLVVFGEIAVGLGLLLGALTGIAALFGGFMNWNYLLAGAASTNPIMGIIAVALVIAWKTAGWWGVDRWLLPALGAPWQRGRLFGGEAQVGAEERLSTATQIEQWVRVLVGVGIALFALSQLTSAPQVLVLLFAAALVAATGLGWLRIFR